MFCDPTTRPVSPFPRPTSFSRPTAAAPFASSSTTTTIPHPHPPLLPLHPLAPSHSHSNTHPSNTAYPHQPTTYHLASQPTPIPQLSRSTSAKPPTSLSLKHRPPLRQKSTSQARKKAVQLDLEVKIERAKGFVLFGRGVPPAPPSSPVFEKPQPAFDGRDLGAHDRKAGGGGGGGGEDYFGGGWTDGKRRKGREEWVENVKQGEGMDLDS